MAYEKQNFLDGQIVTADHLNHIEDGIGNVEIALGAYNLLDNSDFTNPVNQRGQSSYSGAVYGIDRWRSWKDGSAIAINDGYITLSGDVHHVQYIDSSVFEDGKSYTFAIMQRNGTLSVVSATYPMEEEYFAEGQFSFFLTDSGTSYVTIDGAGEYVWVALYEGTYTADTLPPYVPKGYAAELMECYRYYQKYKTVGLTCRNNGYATVFLPVTMRVTPTISVGTRTLYTSSCEDVAADYPSVNLQADPNLIYFTNGFYTGFATITCSNVQLYADL